MERIKLHISSHGKPCLWESGGGYTNTGAAQVIAAEDGTRKKALYVRLEGHRACLDHALLPVWVGDVIVTASYHHNSLIAEIFRIVRIEATPDSKGERYAHVERIAMSDTKDSTEDSWSLSWDREDVASKYREAIDAALDKADTYHCREPVYILPPTPKFKKPPPPEPEPEPEEECVDVPARLLAPLWTIDD